jgi:hydrogenase small subunit
MPGFPDKFMPFMEDPAGAGAPAAASTVSGSAIRILREIRTKPGADEPQVTPSRATSW